MLPEVKRFIDEVINDHVKNTELREMIFAEIVEYANSNGYKITDKELLFHF